MVLKPMRPVTVLESDIPKLRYPQLLSEKLNGFRAPMIPGKGLQSKSGERFPSLIVEDLFSHLPHPLDCELIYGDPLARDSLQLTKSAVGSRHLPINLDPGALKLYVFDLHSSFGNARDRYKALQDLSPAFPPNVILVQKFLVSSPEELKAFVASTLEEGHEGIVGNLAASFYVHGNATIRDQSAWKIKPTLDEEFIVTGFEEQYQNLNPEMRTPTGRLKRSTSQDNLAPKDTLGALLVHSPHWGSCRIGTGFTDAMRRWVWDNKSKLIGCVVTASYYPTISTDKPMALSFKCFRPGFDM